MVNVDEVIRQREIMRNKILLYSTLVKVASIAGVLGLLGIIFLYQADTVAIMLAVIFGIMAPILIGQTIISYHMHKFIRLSVLLLKYCREHQKECREKDIDIELLEQHYGKYLQIKKTQK